MNIGSKVRLLHGREEGVITKISGNFVEIDLGDGFGIPVLASEVVLISPAESRLAATAEKRPTEVSPSARKTFSTKGIYLVFVPINDREITLHLVNLTDWKILFTIFGRSEGKVSGLASGTLEGASAQLITKLLWKDFEKWPVFDTQLLYFSESQTPESFYQNYSLRCRAQSYHKRLQKAPFLDVKGHVYQIDIEENQNPAFTTEQLREKMLGAGDEKSLKTLVTKRVSPEIDLHADALPEITSDTTKEEIFKIQISVFNAYLEQAIAGGLEKITVIHGVGQGTLRQEIHRILSKHPHVAYFKDAQKEKFGYGATIAHLH